MERAIARAPGEGRASTPALAPELSSKDSPCPLLRDNECTIYDNRPFICRLLPHRTLSAVESTRASSPREGKEELERLKRSCPGLKWSHYIQPDEKDNYLKEKEIIEKEMLCTLSLFDSCVGISRLSSSDVERLCLLIDTDVLGTGIHSIFFDWEEKTVNIPGNDEGLGQLLETHKRLVDSSAHEGVFEQG